MASAKGLLSGCPVAVSDIPTMRGIYRLNSQEPYAIAISPRSGSLQDGIVDAAVYFMQNRNVVREMTARGQEAMKQNYSPHIVACKHIGLYRDLRDFKSTRIEGLGHTRTSD